MAEPRINAILHIGAGKCGSSALQTHLSMNPEFLGSKGERYVYAALGADGSLRSGEGLRRHAMDSVYGYDASANLASGDLPPGFKDVARRRLSRLMAAKSIPVLSCEGWNLAAERFEAMELPQGLGLSCDVVFFIRPQLEWLNSAWWQWGAWTGVAFERWLQASRADARWDLIISKWRRLPGVRRVTVRVLGDDVVSQFMRILGAPLRGPTRRVNGGVSPELLRYLQKNRKFRPGPHSPQLEFILARWVKFKSTARPWVIDRKQREALLDYYQQGNRALLDLVERPVRDEIEADRRWWTSAAYEAKDVEPPEGKDLVVDYESMIEDLLDAIAAFDGRTRDGWPPSQR